jgi:hypothetical protein
MKAFEGMQLGEKHDCVILVRKRFGKQSVGTLRRRKKIKLIWDLQR